MANYKKFVFGGTMNCGCSINVYYLKNERLYSESNITSRISTLFAAQAAKQGVK